MKHWIRWMVLCGALSLAAAEPDGWSAVPVELMAQVWRNAAYLSDAEKAGLDAAAASGPTAPRLAPGPELEREIAAMLPLLTEPIGRWMTRLRPEQKRRLTDDWAALVRPSATRNGLPGDGKQWMRMAGALDLNAGQRLALARMALDMKSEMPARLQKVQRALETYGAAVINGGAALQSQPLAAALSELINAGARNQTKFFATLDSAQRARAKEMLDEMRSAMFAGGGV